MNLYRPCTDTPAQYRGNGTQTQQFLYTQHFHAGSVHLWPAAVSQL